MDTTKFKELTQLIGKSIGVEPHDISSEAIDTLMTIARGMYWSEDFYTKVLTLKKEIKEELENFSKMLNA